MELKNHLKIMIDKIEDNVSEKINVEQIASECFISSPKLYRDFYNLTGHSVKEYIRKRKLSNALALIKTSDIELTDIALQCGYSSHQTLCRAVRQMLDLTPSEYKSSDTYYFFPPFSGEPLQSVTVSNSIIPETLRLLYFNSKLTDIENMAVKTFLQALPNYSGRIFGRNGKQNRNKFCYELYVTDVDADYNILKLYDFEVSERSSSFSSLFATSTLRNNESKINAAWDYLYSEWLQNSMFEYTNEPYYEEYIIKNRRPVKLKLYLPIRKRSEDTKITLTENPRLCFITAKAKGYNAEKIASETVIDDIKTHYPHIIKSSKDLYFCKKVSSYICGVRVNSEVQLTGDENIMGMATENNHYLVLESGVTGDYDRYALMLFSFAQENGMDADREGIFAVYNAERGFQNLSIKMYCPVKIVIK